MLYIFKKSLNGLWKHNTNLLDKMLYTKLLLGTEHIIYNYIITNNLLFGNIYISCYIKCYTTHHSKVLNIQFIYY